MKTESKAILRSLRVSPRKVRLLIDLIRGMKADEALAQLQFSKKWAARPVKKLLDSAIANAIHNHKIDPKTLVVKTAFVDGGSILYRWKPRAFGRAAPIRKRTAHVTIILEGDAKEEKEAKPEKKVEPKAKTVEKTEKKTAAPKKKAAKKDINKSEKGKS